MTIRPCTWTDRASVLAIVNGAAVAYRGVIPPDRWHEPYMSAEELADEIARGVVFHGLEADGELLAVMGLQDRGDVALIRHAYVHPDHQRIGAGTRLLRHAEACAGKPVLIGTWAAADWAIAFYRRNGYRLVPQTRKAELLRRYWTIPERQVETSVVLAQPSWWERPGA